MSELDGPSPEEMGISQAGNKEDKGKTEIEDKFETYVQNVIAPVDENFKVKALEKENLFVALDDTSVEGTYAASRRYYQAVRTENDRIGFTLTSWFRSEENNDGKNYSFTKYGRAVLGRYGFASKQEFETLEFLEENGGFRLNYGLHNIKGEAASPGAPAGEWGSQLYFEYAPNGKLDYLQPFVMGGTGDLALIDQDPKGGLFGSLEEFLADLGEGKSYTLNGLRIDAKFSQTDGKIELALFNPEGKEEYRLVVPTTVDIESVAAEVGLEQLRKDPTQPSSGIKGEGVGDLDWRTKSFPDLVGVKVVPVG
ncbi:MAG: hypothetical protein Q8P13_04650 [bacterium]|nr:hypothetical protein [bacterium]